MVDDTKIDSLIEKYINNNNSVIFLNNALIISSETAKSLHDIFSIDVRDNLCNMFNKTYRIEHSEKTDHRILEKKIKFVVYKNNKEIYSEEYDEFMPFPKKVWYNKYKPNKPFFFNLTNFWWRLNLEKAKMLLDVRI